MTAEIKELILEYSNFVNQFDGDDITGLIKISNEALREAEAHLSKSEFDDLKKGIDDFLILTSKLKEINTQSVSFKSHLIGLGILIETKILFII